MSKVPVYEVFIHYFENMSASGGFGHRPRPGLRLWTTLRDCGTPNLPTPGKNRAGAHAFFVSHANDNEYNVVCTVILSEQCLNFAHSHCGKVMPESNISCFQF